MNQTIEQYREVLIPEQLRQVAANDAIVQVCLTYYTTGHCSLQEATQAAVVALARNNADLRKMLAQAAGWRDLEITLSRQEVQAELVRLGIDTGPAVARVLAALAKEREGK